MKTIQLSTPHDLHVYLSDFYNDIAYDGSPEFKDFIPKGIWVSLFEDKQLAGFINVEPLNNITWVAHIMIYKKFRGNCSEEWGKRTAQYIRENLDVRKILAFTPYISAKRYAEKVGFKCIGILQQSIKKNGDIMDQYMLELDTQLFKWGI